MSVPLENMIEIISEAAGVKSVYPVGRYIEVVQYEDAKKLSLGNSKDVPQRGWRVVRIDWENKSYILAPKEDLE